MNRKYVWARIGVLLDLAIALLLVLAVQVGSSDLKVVKQPNTKAFALCIGPNALFVLEANGGLGMGARCPDWSTGNPAAFIKAEHPSFLSVAIALLFVKAFITWFLVERPEELPIRAERRRQQRLALKSRRRS
jgi:hypothetical protein